MLKKVFKIDKAFYPETAILQGCEIFSENFSIRYINYELVIETQDDNHDMIFGEFMNYQIYLQLQ